MSTKNGKSYSDIKNVNLRGGMLGSGLIRFAQVPENGTQPTNWASDPFSSTEVGLYVNSAGSLVFSTLGTATVLGATGSSSGIPSWNTIFGATQTLSVQGTVFTIQDTTAAANNVLTLTDSNSGASGNLLTLNQSGTGKDILGTSSSWSVTKLGAGAFLSVASATINGAGAGLTLGDSGANVITIGTGSNTVTIAKAATFSSTITGVSESLVSTSNTVVPLLVTNNTLTTFGAGVANGGLLVVRSTSATTGTIIRAQGADGSLTTGKYFEAWDTTDSDSVFSVGVSGATKIAGVASGTASLTLTAGDLVVTSGNVVVTAGGLTSASPTGAGIGYATGAGGTVTQITSRSTGVTINTLSGKIQTMTTSLAAESSAEFTVTNSTVAIGDVVVVAQRSGSSNVAGVAGVTQVEVVTVAAGSFIVSVNNQSTTTAETGAIIINFAVIKAVTA